MFTHEFLSSLYLRRLHSTPFVIAHAPCMAAMVKTHVSFWDVSVSTIMVDKDCVLMCKKGLNYCRDNDLP